MKDTRYTYGTTTTAASRLEEISKFFNPLATDLIRQIDPGSRNIAMDVGCGPGFTTDMLAEASGCHETYGLDISTEFLEMARHRFKHCTFLEHDITSIPFPVAGDVMYARFLLCHLREPIRVVHAWLTQLNPGGLLFIEDLEAIDTDLDVFKKYLVMSEGMISTQGASLYVGRTIAEARYSAEVLLNESVILPISNRRAASWFHPNTQSIWNKDPYVLEHLDVEERKSIAEELEQLKERQDARSDITFRLRRLVLKNE